MKMDWFENMMSAITFAESGEHETAREFLKGGKTVLLALSDRMFDKHALKYAMSISERVGASLEILYVKEIEKRNEGLKGFVSEVKKVGFSFSVVVKSGCMKRAILDYTEKRKEIVFVVIGSTPELDVGCGAAEKELPDVWKKLKCPLVVVSKAQEPSAA